jgi:hypothetical protein
MRRALVFLIVAAAPTTAGAGELEVAAYGGYTFPFYSQTFTYDPGPVTVPIPGVDIEQSGNFQLDASGGRALGGAATFYPTDGLGFEVRLDSADASVATRSGTYSVRVGLPPPLEPVLADLTLEGGTADLKALRPWSLNLKLRAGDVVRFTVSGGLSRLGNFEFSIQQKVALGVSAVNVATGNLEIATLTLRGVSSVDTKSAWGGNAGLGLQIGVGERGAILLEGRGFYFPKRTIEWEPQIDTPLGTVEKLLLDRVRERLEPIELRPWWVQATVGVAIRF